MEEKEQQVPVQPKGERVKMAIFWSILAVLFVLAAMANMPYDRFDHNPIMAKAELYRSIADVREKVGGHWPKDQRDPDFVMGVKGLGEQVRPTFALLETKSGTEHETALYRLTFRGRPYYHELEHSSSPNPRRRRL